MALGESAWVPSQDSQNRTLLFQL